MDTVPIGPTNYLGWTPDQLLSRITKLEDQLKQAQQELQTARRGSSPGRIQPRALRPFDRTKYSFRHIALKFAYLGQRYNGFEHHANNQTPLPTVEEVLWKALVKARLIFPETIEDEPDKVNWDGCEYSKCGRTDRGVSAFGQVIGIKVRSNRPLSKCVPKLRDPNTRSTESTGLPEDGMPDLLLDLPASDNSDMVDGADFHDDYDELPYPQILNRLLPPDIRVLAWCPSLPADFSARFSCRERRYRYFFTQPAFSPTPGAPGFQQSLTKGANGQLRRDGWLDIEAMRAAAKKYEGLHDFRNLCKVDPSKQLDNFQRRIFLSEIREVDAASQPAAFVTGTNFAELLGSSVSSDSAHRATDAPKVYQFVLHGSAFLWHQVRHMVAVLFLVGQGLERPSVVDDLMDIDQNPCKPNYEMAEDAPLVLWDCIFPDEGSDNREDAMRWVWIGDESDPNKSRDKGVKGTGKFGIGAVVDELWQLWRQRKMDEILAGSLLNLAVAAGGVHAPELQKRKRGDISRYVFQGGNSAKPKGVYVPLMEKEKLESVEKINAKYRERKGISLQPVKAYKESRTDHIE